MNKHTIVRIIRYILPLVVLLLIAAYLIISPAMFTHAAGAIQHAMPKHGFGPHMYWPGNW